jgi:hypothetical protein
MVKERRTSKARLALQILVDAIGRDDIKVELVTGEDWTARSESADCTLQSPLPRSVILTLVLQKGRIFLAGDAARQMAPTGTSSSPHPNSQAPSAAIQESKTPTT